MCCQYQKVYNEINGRPPGLHLSHSNAALESGISSVYDAVSKNQGAKRLSHFKLDGFNVCCRATCVIFLMLGRETNKNKEHLTLRKVTSAELRSLNHNPGESCATGSACVKLVAVTARGAASIDDS